MEDQQSDIDEALDKRIHNLEQKYNKIISRQVIVMRTSKRTLRKLEDNEKKMISILKLNPKEIRDSCKTMKSIVELKVFEELAMLKESISKLNDQCAGETILACTLLID